MSIAALYSIMQQACKEIANMNHSDFSTLLQEIEHH